MSYSYSPSTRGFYHDDQKAPADAVSVSDADYHAMLDAQGNGSMIVPGSDGRPTLESIPVEPVTTVRTVTTFRLMSALTSAQRAAYPTVDPWDQRLFTARDTPWPEDDPQIARMASVIGISSSAWFDAALKALPA